MSYYCMLCEPVPAKVRDYICKKRAGEAIDKVMVFYGFKVYKKGFYFAIQEEGNYIGIVSFLELVRMSTYLMEKTLKAPNISPVTRAKVQMSYMHLKKLRDNLMNESKNTICLKCGAEGSIVRMKSGVTDEPIRSLCCPVCMNRDALEHFSSYKSKRNL